MSDTVYVGQATMPVSVDEELSNTSTNPVQNKVIYSALQDKQDTLPAGNVGQFLQKTSTGQQWSDVDTLPSQTGNNGKFLTTNGTSASWSEVDALPSQSGQSGKFLTTDGSSASWATVSFGANTSLSNLTDAGKIQVAHLAMPGDVYDDLTPVNDQIYTAPADGYYMVFGISTSSDTGLSLCLAPNNEYVATSPHVFGFTSGSALGYNYVYCINAPVKAGDKVRLGYTNVSFSFGSYTNMGLRFFYAKGAESEYVPPAS